MSISIRLRRKGALLASLSVIAVLAGCGGAEESATDGFYSIAPSPGGSGTFAAYFMASITDEWRSAAANVRDNVARYRFNNGTALVNTQEVFANPLFSSRAEYAHTVGLTGAGQVISIVDDGFLRSHEAFAGKQNSVTGDPEIAWHGTLVASIAAGDSATMVGIAPGADIAFGKAFSDGDPEADFVALTNAANDAARRRAVAQNNSWGYTFTPADQGNFDAVFASTEAQNWLAALQNYAQNGVVIFAVANEMDHVQSNILEALPNFVPSLRDAWLTVGNATPIFNDDEIVEAELQSSSCFQAREWCLVADGFWRGASDEGTDIYDQGFGSSFAAPQVAGALALLAEAFPNLTPHELRGRLLASADNSFVGFIMTGSTDVDPSAGEYMHDYSDEFGHGFLDIRAALLPIGSTTLSTTGGQVIATKDFNFSTGGAMGDAVARSLDGIDLSVQDALGGDFDVAARSFAGEAAPASLVSTVAARSLSRDYRASRTGAINPLADVFDAHPGQTIELNAPDGNTKAALLMGAGENYGLAVSRDLTEGDLKINLGVKLARDDGSMMGFSNSRDEGGATMASLTLGLSHDVGNGGFFALSGEMGVADLGAPIAIASVSNAEFNSVTLDVGSRSVFSNNDRLALGVSMPVAVTSGSASLAVSGVRSAGGLETLAAPIDLAPEERQVEFSLSYQVPMSDSAEMLFEVVRAENYGNRAGFSDTAAVIGMKLTF